MDTLIKNRGIIIVAIIVMLLMFGYKIFFGGADVSESEASDAPIGEDLLKISAELSQAALNQEILSEPRYMYLIDFSTVIPDQPRGRKNPFDVLGQ